MGQAANLSISDGQATPVAVTFAVERVTPELSVFADRSTGVGSRFRRITTRFTTGAKVTRTSMKIAIPVWGTLQSGAEGVLRTIRATVDYELPDGCTAAERNDLHAFVVNSLNNSLIRGNMRDLDPLY